MTVGPKNYAYKISCTLTGRTDTVYKAKGINLNYNSKRLLNFEVISDMILGTGGSEPTMTVHTERKIKRKREEGGIVDVVAEPDGNLCRISLFKRRRLCYNTSVPFGYK